MEILVKVLAEDFTLEELKNFRRKIALDLASRAGESIHISSTSREGRSNQGMVLASLAEKASFLSACEAAIGILEQRDTVPSGQTHIDFSRWPVET
ncbi:MAG: hypothetical protein AB7I98_03835 [Verrucomicrobiales bacterium]